LCNRYDPNVSPRQKVPDGPNGYLFETERRFLCLHVRNSIDGRRWEPRRNRRNIGSSASSMCLLPAKTSSSSSSFSTICKWSQSALERERLITR
jgi:hypothetical protein